MFYVLAGLWFGSCIVKTFVSPDLRKSILTLFITTIAMSALILAFGSPQVAGITLAVGFLPCAIRLTTFRISQGTRQ